MIDGNLQVDLGETECPDWDSTSQFVPTRLARIRPDPTHIRHGMIRGYVSGGQGCHRLHCGFE